MRMILSSGLLALFFALSAPTHATEVNRPVTVTDILPFASARPAAPTTEGIIRIYVNAASWGATTCRNDAADLQASDKHLVAILMSAWLADRPIIIGVDDSLRPHDDTCQVTLVRVQK